RIAAMSPTRTEVPSAKPSETVGSPPIADPDLERRFRELADEWQADVAPLSSTTARVEHPAHPRIVELGPAAAPPLPPRRAPPPRRPPHPLLPPPPDPPGRRPRRPRRSRSPRRDGRSLDQVGQGTRIPVMDHLETLFPGLSGSGYVITSPADDRYNCIAWAA